MLACIAGIIRTRCASPLAINHPSPPLQPPTAHPSLVWPQLQHRPVQLPCFVDIPRLLLQFGPSVPGVHVAGVNLQAALEEGPSLMGIATARLGHCPRLREKSQGEMGSQPLGRRGLATSSTGQTAPQRGEAWVKGWDNKGIKYTQLSLPHYLFRSTKINLAALPNGGSQGDPRTVPSLQQHAATQPVAADSLPPAFN